MDATVTAVEPGSTVGSVEPGSTGTKVEFDLAERGVREVNSALRRLPAGASATILNPMGRHNLAVALDTPISVTIAGPAGYYCAGLGAEAEVTVAGPVGWGVGENLMSGTIRVAGDASQSVAASAHGGTVIVGGRASLRTGISLKGGTIAVAGSVGSFCGFMAQAGTILIGGDAGDGLGDSLYEAVIYVAGKIKSLGTDAQVEEMTEADLAAVTELVTRCGFDHIDPANVTKVASARQLYHFATHNHNAY